MVRPVSVVIWVLAWLAVGEALYRGVGWDRTLSGFIGILAASMVVALVARRERLHGSADKPDQPRAISDRVVKREGPRGA
jgi:hypothetical protein